MKLFQGRIRRGYYFGGGIVTSIVLGLLNSLIGSLLGYGMLSRILMVMIAAVGVVLGVSLLVRRLHDMNKPEWYAILMLIPFVNFFAALWVLFTRGDEGANTYGPAPTHTTLISAVLNQ